MEGLGEGEIVKLLYNVKKCNQDLENGKGKKFEKAKVSGSKVGFRYVGSFTSQ